MEIVGVVASIFTLMKTSKCFNQGYQAIRHAPQERQDASDQLKLISSTSQLLHCLVNNVVAEAPATDQTFAGLEVARQRFTKIEDHYRTVIGDAEKPEKKQQSKHKTTFQWLIKDRRDLRRLSGLLNETEEALSAILLPAI
jgi:hypothetical protein